MKKLATLTAVLVACTSLYTAQAKTASQAADGISPATEKFITNAKIGNRFEVDTSKIALDRTEDATVREFAKMMVEDHTHAMESMKGFVPTDAPPALGAAYDAKHAQKIEALRKTSDESFDAAYIKAQKEAHAEAVSLFSNYAKQGDEKDLKGFAAATLPTLKAHEAHINSFKKTGDEYTAAPMKTPVTNMKKPGENPMGVQR